MSYKSPRPPVKVEPSAARPEDVLVLGSQDSWMATRFALPTFHLGQVRSVLRTQLTMETGVNRYRLDGLTPEKRAELFALLAGQGIEFDLWR